MGSGLSDPGPAGSLAAFKIAVVLAGTRRLAGCFTSIGYFEKRRDITDDRV